MNRPSSAMIATMSLMVSSAGIATEPAPLMLRLLAKEIMQLSTDPSTFSNLRMCETKNTPNGRKWAFLSFSGVVMVLIVYPNGAVSLPLLRDDELRASEKSRADIEQIVAQCPPISDATFQSLVREFVR